MISKTKNKTLLIFLIFLNILLQLVLQFEGKIKNVETQRGPIQTELDNCQAELNRKLEQATTDTQQRVVTTR